MTGKSTMTVELSDADLREAVSQYLYRKYQVSDWDVHLGAKSVSHQPNESDMAWVACVKASRES